MNNTGHTGEKAGYRIILLLVVGLAAFSSAMKELNQLQQFSLDASRLIAEWSPKIQSDVPQVVVKVEQLDNINNLEQSVPAIELPWLAHDSDTCDAELKELSSPRASGVQTRKIERIVRRQRSTDFGPSESQIAKLKKLSEINIDPVKFEVRVPTDHAEPDSFIFTEIPAAALKAGTRKNNVIRLNVRDREMLLKTLNRNLRSAG